MLGINITQCINFTLLCVESSIYFKLGPENCNVHQIWKLRSSEDLHIQLKQSEAKLADQTSRSRLCSPRAAEIFTSRVLTVTKQSQG